MDFRDKDFDGEDLQLDGNRFTGCTFRRCRLEFRGTTGVNIVACTFGENNTWALNGAAGTTCNYLSMMYRAGGQAIVEGIFTAIREGRVSGNAEE